MRLAIDRVHVLFAHRIGLPYHLLLLVNQTVVLLGVQWVANGVVLITEMLLHLLILLRLLNLLILLQACWIWYRIRLMLKAVHLLLLLLHL